MYSTEAIQILVDRIAWRQPAETDEHGIVLSDENKEGTSGQFFNSFHTTAIPENVYLCIENDLADQDEFNEFLLQMKKDSAIEVLKKVFDTNPLANYPIVDGAVSVNYAVDYSSAINTRQGIFDEAIGQSMATRCLQLFLTTNRSNATETSLGLSYDQMQFEKDGIKNEFGRSIAKGTKDKMEAEINNIIKVLFPTNTSSSTRPTLRARKYW